MEPIEPVPCENIEESCDAVRAIELTGDIQMYTAPLVGRRIFNQAVGRYGKTLWVGARCVPDLCQCDQTIKTACLFLRFQQNAICAEPEPKRALALCRKRLVADDQIGCTGGPIEGSLVRLEQAFIEIIDGCEVRNGLVA